MAEFFLREIGQKKLADDAIEHHEQLRKLVEEKLVMRKASDVLTKYAKIQQLYPKSSISKHRVIFWYHSLIKLQNDLTIDSIKSIRDCHESIIQSEDSSVEGTRAQSAIEEPREAVN